MSTYFIDRTGETVIDVTEFQEAGSFSEGLAVVKTAKTFCGFINKSGAVVIEPRFFEAGIFSEGLSVVKTQEKGFLFQPEDKWGFIDKTGNIIFEANLDRLHDFSEGIAVAKKGEEFFFIDKTGREILTLDANKIELEFLGNQKFSEGLIVACDSKTRKCGFINKSGEYIIDPKFENAASFSEGLARVSVIENNTEYLGFINPKGEYVIPPKFDIDYDFLRCTNDFSEGLASLIDEPPTVERDPCFMYIDKTGEIALRTEFFNTHPFHEGLAVVWDAESEKNGFIDKSGKLVIPLKYDIAANFSEGLAYVGYH